ncbi:MAG: hypothetical protein MN733_13685 [Nitrososphaera sp.]|nr:hypothetical protein [Nitrososphaera sp.]
MAVRRRLITNAIVVGIATLILGVVSYYMIDNLLNFWIPELEDHDQLLAQHLQMRRDEKDFLARDTQNPAFFETGQSQYLDSFMETHEEMHEVLERIEAAELSENDLDFIHVVEEAHELDDAYGDTFMEVAEKYRQRGMLGYGIIGQLDDAGSDLQEYVAAENDVRLSQLAADFRLEEKNYLITRDPARYESVQETLRS